MIAPIRRIYLRCAHRKLNEQEDEDSVRKLCSVARVDTVAAALAI